MTNDSLISLTKMTINRQNRIEELEEKVKLLENVLKKAYDIGHNNDCILCGLKDRIILKRIGGKMEEEKK